MAEASAPASSANLGPGFDTLALALELRCRVEALAADEWTVHHAGRERPEAGSEDAVLMAARVATDDELPLSLRVDNDVPLGRGLGSSAAAAAAGATAALLAVGREVDPLRVYRLVTDLEGHPDNAAATVFGGLVAALPDRAIRLGLHPDLVPVLAVPDRRLSTRAARRLVADQVARSVAVRSLARLVALTEGLRTGDSDLLTAAGGDELHEAPRNAVHPDVGALIDLAAEAGALHACWSGAGPSVLAFATDPAELVRAWESVLDGAGRVLTPGVAQQGLLWDGSASQD